MIALKGRGWGITVYIKKPVQITDRDSSFVKRKYIYFITYWDLKCYQIWNIDICDVNIVYDFKSKIKLSPKHIRLTG